MPLAAGAPLDVAAVMVFGHDIAESKERLRVPAEVIFLEIHMSQHDTLSRQFYDAIACASGHYQPYACA